MFNYLDRLRRKPQHVRMQITYVTTSVLFFIILTMWWTSWTASGGREEPSALVQEKSPIRVVTEVFTGLKEETASSWKDVLADIQTYASTSVQVAAVANSQSASSTGGIARDPDLQNNEGINFVDPTTPNDVTQ